MWLHVDLKMMLNLQELKAAINVSRSWPYAVDDPIWVKMPSHYDDGIRRAKGMFTI